MDAKAQAKNEIMLRIEAEADPIGFLIQVARGEGLYAAKAANNTEVILVYPTLDQRIKAHLVLEKRLEKGVEEGQKGPNGQNAGLSPVDVESLREKLAADIARMIAAKKRRRRKTPAEVVVGDK